MHENGTFRQYLLKNFISNMLQNIIELERENLVQLRVGVEHYKS